MRRLVELVVVWAAVSAGAARHKLVTEERRASDLVDGERFHLQARPTILRKP